MFRKKIYEKLDAMSCDLREVTNRTIGINNQQYNISRVCDQALLNNIEATKTIEAQQKVISQLMDMLCNKYEHGLFVMSNDTEMPTVIKDGKIITENKVSSFRVDWAKGEPIILNVDYLE